MPIICNNGHVQIQWDKLKFTILAIFWFFPVRGDIFQKSMPIFHMVIIIPGALFQEIISIFLPEDAALSNYDTTLILTGTIWERVVVTDLY